MFASSQIKKRDFSTELYTGEARESFAFHKFIINSLQAKGLSSTIQQNCAQTITVPLQIQINKAKYEEADRQVSSKYLLEKAAYKNALQRYKTSKQEIEQADGYTSDDKRTALLSLKGPRQPVWTPPPPSEFTKEQSDTYNRITANAAAMEDKSSIALSHILDHCHADVILACNEILENEEVTLREKLLALFEWIKRRRLADNKVVSKVQDDMRHLPIANDWHEAVSNTLTMSILQEELRTMGAPYSDRDLIIIHLQYLSDETQFQHLKHKHSQNDDDDTDLYAPTLRVRAVDGTMSFPKHTKAVSATNSTTWKQYCAEVKRYQMSLQESQPKSALTVRASRSSEKSVNATTSDSTLKAMITDTVKEAIQNLIPSTPKQQQQNSDRSHRNQQKQQDRFQHNKDRNGRRREYPPQNSFPFSTPPYMPPPFIPPSFTPPPMPFPPRMPYYPRAPVPIPTQQPQPHPQQPQDPRYTPPNPHGGKPSHKRAHAAAFESQDPLNQHALLQHYQQQQEYFANAAYMHAYSAALHNEAEPHPATSQSSDAPGDYSSADDSN